MNIIYFIRLLLKHTVLLIFSPIIVAVIIFFITKDEPKAYESSAHIYSGITSGASIVSLDESKVDRLTSMISFDNMISTITSRSTLEEVSIRLLASHLVLNKPVPEIISEEHFNQLIENVPEEVKSLVVKGDYEKTVEKLISFKESNYTNYVYKLLNSEHPNYSTEAIQSNIKVKRIRSSDLIEISFVSNDPGICKNTLDLLIDVFGREYTETKLSQTNDVVEYFEEQLANASEKLEKAEDELLQFNKKNVIINYYEQTEQITTEKKDFNLKYLDVKMAYAGAKSAIVALESKMSEKQKRKLTNQSIQKIREKLAEVNFEIAMSTINTLDSIPTNNIDSLYNQSRNLEADLRNKVQEQYDLEYSKEGVGTKFLIDEWIVKVIDLESSRAKLNVAELQERKFNDIYLKYAPLGATMKKLERKIDVIEREYLQILHDLGLAKLKQQSIELNSNLRVSDPPLFPLNSKPSKRLILMMIGMIIGFVIPASLIIFLDFIDQSIRTEKRAEKIIGLKVAAIFPGVGRVNRNLDVDFIMDRALAVLVRRLILNKEARQNTANMPDSNLVFSVLDKEGKTMLLELLLERITKIGYKTLFITPNPVDKIPGVDVCVYEINNSFHKCEHITDLMDSSHSKDISSYDFVFVELPGILTNNYPVNLFNEIDHSFLVARANRVWTKSDENALKDILEFVPSKKPQVILNGVAMIEMENVMGDLPQKRSAFRKFLKRIFLLRFSSKQDFDGRNKKKGRTKKNLNSFLLFILSAVFCSANLSLISPDTIDEPDNWAESIFDSEELDVDIEKPEIESHSNTQCNYSYLGNMGESWNDETGRIDDNPIDIIRFKSGTGEEAGAKRHSGTKLIPVSSETIIDREKIIYYVICGSFKEQKNADTLFGLLTQMGYSPEILTRENSLKSVALGKFVDESEAASNLQNYLLKMPDSGAWVYATNAEMYAK